MAKSYSEIVKLKEPLEVEYEDRHSAHRKLRKFWHGRYWDQTEVDSGGVSSIFRDLTARSSDVGPDIKLVNNLLKDVCVKFQTFLSPLPMIRSYVDPPASQKRKNQATLKERFLYGTWAANQMNKVLSDQGWYLPLMGDCFHGIFPDFKTNMCRSILRSPENAFPIRSFDNDGLDAIIFCWKARQSAVKRMFPDYVPKSDHQKGRFRTGFRKAQPSDPEVEIIEWSDTGEFSRFAGEQKMNGVEHDLGFNLFEHVKFINVPGEVWGHGAVEQAVNLVEMGNAYLSLMMQSAIENVFPTLVLVDPMKAPEELERGAGAVIPVNAGGKVEYLVPPGGNLLANAQWAQEVERMVKSDTSMPDVNFGNFQASVVTGKAINELQGAGTGSLVEMVQGVSIGRALVSWNEKAIQIARTMFKDDSIYLFGAETPSLAEINPRHFSFKIKGSQLVGSTRNEVVFMPYLDMHSKVVMGLQMAGAMLVSREWQRNQVGIPDSEAMDDEIVSEAIQDAVVQHLVQSIQDPSMAAEAEQQAQSYIEGSAEQSAAPTPPILGVQGPPMPPGLGPRQRPEGLMPAGAPPGPMPPGAPPGPMPPGAPPGAAPPTGPEQGAPAPGQGLKLDSVISAFAQIQPRGRVFLVGEIVATGQTADDVEVALTEAADREQLASLPFPTTARIVQGEPQEPWIEVTPGAVGMRGGENAAPVLEPGA